jgi:enoyl-CoA hydratase/carnithine racemase
MARKPNICVAVARLEAVRVETVEDRIGVVALNRPASLNALSMAMDRELESALSDFERAPAIRAVIVTGAGDRAFSAGGDIHEMAALTPAEMDARRNRRREWTWHLANLEKPTIAAVNGLAYGAGALLATALDLRIGCEHTRFRFLAVKGLNSTWTLPPLVGLARAKELLYTARVVEAEEALALGLLNRVVPSAELREAAIAMARLIADNPPANVRGIKRLLHEDIGRSWLDRYRAEDAAAAPAGSVNIDEVFSDFLSRKAKG